MYKNGWKSFFNFWVIIQFVLLQLRINNLILLCTKMDGNLFSICELTHKPMAVQCATLPHTIKRKIEHLKIDLL